MDEVFGAPNHFATVVFNKTTGFTDQRVSCVYDCLVWYGKDVGSIKYRQVYQSKAIGLEGAGVYNKVELPDGTRRRLTAEELETIDRLPEGWRVFSLDNIMSQGEAKEPQPFEFEGNTYLPAANSHWKAKVEGLRRLAEKRRIEVSGSSLRYYASTKTFRSLRSPTSGLTLGQGRSRSRRFTRCKRARRPYYAASL
jgi:adenine-specific DNA-methyltransferase